jgi:hypothetical protein
MAAKVLHDVARVGWNVLSAVIDTTGLVTAQLGNAVTQRAKSDADEFFYPPGIVSLPRAPDAGKAGCETAVITRSDHNAIVGCRDARDASIVNGLSPALDYGETLVFSGAGGGYTVFRKDKSIQTFAGDGNASVSVKQGGEVDVFASVVKLGDSGATPVALSSSVLTELGKIATSIGQCAGYINGITPGTVTAYVPGSVAASKVSAT